MRKAARVDANQSEIVSGLRYLGFSVQCLHAVGGGCPDLLVGTGKGNYLLEVKDGDKPPSRRVLTKEQETWHRAWVGPKAVVTSLPEALAAIGIKPPVYAPLKDDDIDNAS